MVIWIQGRNIMVEWHGRTQLLSLWHLGSGAGKQSQKGRHQGSDIDPKVTPPACALTHLEACSTSPLDGTHANHADTIKFSLHSLCGASRASPIHVWTARSGG